MRERAEPKRTKNESRNQRDYRCISFGSINLLVVPIGVGIFCLLPQERKAGSKIERTERRIQILRCGFRGFAERRAQADAGRRLRVGPTSDLLCFIGPALVPSLETRESREAYASLRRS